MPPVTQEQIDNTGMSLQEMSVQNAQAEEGQAAAARIAENRRLRDSGMSARDARRTIRGVEPTVSANQLAENVTPVTVPEPEVETIPAGPLNVARNVSRNAQGFIEAQTAEQEQLRELQNTFGAISDQGSLSDFYTQQREQFGATPENLQELQDIQLRLSDMDTESGLRKVNIESGGQGAIQGLRSLNQEDRENAVRTAGLAARAAVIQGNIDTATQLAKDAVDIEYQQRTLTANNLLNQINMVQGQVDDQTAQLLEQEKRQYEAELATIQEVKDSVANAMVNGATQAEIAQLTSDQVGDAEKIALAQSITARGAGEMRDLEIEGQRASNAASWALANERMTGGETFTTPDGGQITTPTFEEWAEVNGGRVWQVGGTEEAMKNLRQEYEDEMSVMEQAARVASLSTMAREVVNNPQAYYDFTATQKGEIFEELSKAGLDTKDIIAGKKRPLPATQVTEITQAQGVKEDVQTLYDKLQALPGNGPIGGRLQALDPWNAQRVEIEALITSIVPGLARGIFNEVGVLTDQDVERYRNTLANPNMTDEQIELLHNQTMSKIDQSLSLGLDNYGRAGYAVDKFMEETLPEPTEVNGTEEDPLGLNIPQ